MGERCPTCGQSLPFAQAKATERELDLLAAWWGTKNVRKAAIEAGVGYQRAKNMLARCRIRSGVSSNEALLLAHMDELRSRLVASTSHKSRQAAA